MVANQIGQLAHGSVTVDNQGNRISYTPPVIGQPIQLVLHGILGCAMASAGGNNCASGAAAGITGELTASYLDRNTNLSNQYIIESSKLTGAITAAMVSGPDDGNSVFAGSQIGRNAAENNYLMPQEKAKLVRELGACNGDQGCKDQVQARYEAISEPRDEKFDNYRNQCIAFGNCEKLDTISDQLRAEITTKGNEYYQNHKDEFVKLPQELSIWHNMPTDSNGNIMLSAQNENQKYIHPILGYEVVIDGKGSIVTDPLNVGTYNFYNPAGYGYPNDLITSDNNHFWQDVFPYFLRGNSQSDPSGALERLGRFNIPVGDALNNKVNQLQQQIEIRFGK